MNLRFRKLPYLARRLLIVLAVFLLVGFICLWSLRTNILTRLAKDFLENQGINDPQLFITSLGTDALTVDSIKLGLGHSELTVESMELTFSLSELQASYRIKEATIKGAQLSTKLPASSQESPSKQQEIPSLSNLIGLLDLSPLGTLPFERIQIKDSNLNLLYEGISTNLPFTATAIASDLQTLDLNIHSIGPLGTATLDASLSTPESSSFKTKLSLEEPIAILNSYFPNWKKEFPDLNELESGALEFQATLNQSDQPTPFIDLSLELYDVETSYEEISATLPFLSIKSSVRDFRDIPLNINFTPQRLVRDTLSVAPNKPLALDVRITEGNVLKIQSQNPVTWSYDSDTIQATSTFEAQYNPVNAEQELTLHLASSQLKASDYPLAPFTLSITGNSSQLDFQTSPLKLLEESPAVIQGGIGVIEISEALDKPTLVTFEGDLIPTPIESEGEIVNLPSSEIKFDIQVFETRVVSNLTLDTSFTNTTPPLPDFEDIQGDFNLVLNLSQSDDSDLVTGDASLNASNFSLQSSKLSGHGISAQARIDFQNLDSRQLDTLKLSDEDSLRKFLDHVSISFDWQANQLSAQNFKSQWSGGNVSLQSEKGIIDLTSYFGAGIFEYDDFRLDQLYVENEHSGSLSQLEGKTQLSALLDGVDIQVKSELTISNPLENLSLFGEYEFSPITLLHSDLPAKFIRELAEVSFSGILQASGNFEATSDASDASLSLSVREGAIAYPASQLNAQGLEADIELASVTQLDSGNSLSRIRIEQIDAGDLKSISFESQFHIRGGESLEIDSALLSVFGGEARLDSAQIPFDGSDFQSTIDLDSLDLEQLASYIEFFDGQMQGKVSGYLPFGIRNGEFELLRGDLNLPNGSPASLNYQTAGLLTSDTPTTTQATFSERLLKFLKVDPDRAAEQALGDITITKFDMELFPEDAPETPIRIRLEGIAHSQLADIPVVISTEVHGSLSELYNFLIRLNSL